jgi:hypothetical protein
MSEDPSDDTLDLEVEAVLGMKYESSPCSPVSAICGEGVGTPVDCRILKEYEMEPSEKRLVSGNAENALHASTLSRISSLYLLQRMLLASSSKLTRLHVLPFAMVGRSSSVRLSDLDRYRNYIRRLLEPIVASSERRLEVRNWTCGFARNGVDADWTPLHVESWWVEV